LRRLHAHKEQFQSPKMVIQKPRHAQTVLGLHWLFVCTNNVAIFTELVRLSKDLPLPGKGHSTQ
jgi:hypothetical protein